MWERDLRCDGCDGDGNSGWPDAAPPDGDVLAEQFVTVINAHEIPVGTHAAVDVRGARIAVANVSGTYYSFDDACTQQQCLLSEEGELTGTTVTCTCHGSEFDVRTGNVLAPPATLAVKVYRTRVEEMRCRVRCDRRIVRDRRGELCWRQRRHHASTGGAPMEIGLNCEPLDCSSALRRT